MARNRGFGPPGALERLEQWWYEKTAGDRLTVALCGLAAVVMGVIGLSLLSSGAPPRGQLVASQAPRTTTTYATPVTLQESPPVTLDTTTSSSSTTSTSTRPAAATASGTGSGSRTNTTAAPRAADPPPNTVAPQIQIPPDPGPPATSPPATSPPATSPPATSPPATSPPATSPPGTQPVTSTTILLPLGPLRVPLG